MILQKRENLNSANLRGFFFVPLYHRKGIQSGHILLSTAKANVFSYQLT